ncbi:MAG: 23S rRNA (pseudouridine(1915)-N(3))-methyltransferase RlmH, partial [Gemmatimonadales bacterium]
MEITLLAVGKLRPFYREACDEYLRRLRRYAKLREIEVREASGAPTLAAQRQEEAGRLGARLLAGGGPVVALS